MREIPLTQGQVALVDDEDLELVNKYKWSCRPGKRTFYAQAATRIKGRNYCVKMHRVIMHVPTSQQVDHIDGDGLNNQKSNLRLCNNSENAMNRRKRLNTSSKYKGVSWWTARQRWVADIWLSGKNVRLGTFQQEIEAARVYDAAARIHFGQFAKTNF